MRIEEKIRKKRNQILSTLAVIVGNRDIFPNELAEKGGKEVIKTVKNLGFDVVTLFSEKGQGTIQTREDSKKCAKLFREKIEKIDGVLVTLPNFGDERSIAESIRLSKLNVPVLVHAFPDEKEKMNRKNRRDSFCGKFSLCNSLKQYGIPFTNTRHHIEAPSSEDFKEDIHFFGKVCRVVKNLKSTRLGLIGVRPSPFSTVRYSEKILEGEGISVETVDLSEILERAKKMDEEVPQVQERLARMEEHFSLEGVPRETINKTAKLSVAMSGWAEENDLDAVAVQCWPTVEKFYGIVPCAAMSLMSEEFLPSACESDVTGALSMYALQLASGKPAALVDLNNNYGEDPDKFVAFHCSNFPRSFFGEKPKMGKHFALHENGALGGRIALGPATLLRFSTDDERGKIRSYVAEGEFTVDELETFGGYGVIRIKGLQSLLRYIADEGFEHHVAIVHGHIAGVLEEAIGKYLGWEVHNHTPPDTT
jgi:L-fucose isomerase-like protein